MKNAPLPINEKERLQALIRYNILDTDFEEAYDELTELASNICETPIALISLVENNRQWFKAKIGIDTRETSRSIAFCSHAILQKEIFIIEDALNDERFADNPLVTSDPNIRFYAGVPLITSDGFPLGTLCVIDRKPRVLNNEQVKALKVLAKQVITQLELRLSFQKLQKYTKELDDLNANKDKLFSIISHDIKTPFSSILGYLEMLSNDINTLKKEDIQVISNDLFTAAKDVYNLVENLLQWSLVERNVIKPDPVPLNLSNVIKEIASLFETNASNKMISIVIESEEDTFIYADKNMINSVMLNIIFNAIKFTNQGGSVKISSESLDKFVKIVVSDNGVGINEEEIKKLFQIRNITSTKGTAGEIGTGLGLILCREFIEKSNGCIHIKSEVGIGTELTIKFPKYEQKKILNKDLSR